MFIRFTDTSRRGVEAAWEEARMLGHDSVGDEEHSAPGQLSLSVREGRILFTMEGETVEAGPEMMLTCGAGVHRTVETLSDAACLNVATGG